MRTSLPILALLALLLSSPAYGKRSQVASLPFDMVGSYIVIEASVNGSEPLHFILDSGISSTLITELSAKDSVQLYYSEKTEVNGLGAGDRISAWASYGNELTAGKIKLENQSVFILEEDIFSLSRHAGTRINGIIGSDFFESHVVSINYDTRRIQFHTDSLFQVPKGYSAVPMLQEGHKMFLNVPIEDADGRIRKVRMLVDTGAELAAWFRSFGKDPILLPDRRIRGFVGKGLNGEIEGYLGRMSRLWIGDFPVKNPVVSFPDSATINEAILGSHRDGTLGSQILSRFNLIIDQSKGFIYFKPSWKYKNRFSYNIAGVEVVQHGDFLPLPEVRHIWKESAAQQAGLEIGDLLLEVNGISTFKMTLDEVKGIFESPRQRKIRLIVLRDGKTHEITLSLLEQI